MSEKKQKCLFTDSLHRLGSRFARTSSVPLEIICLNTHGHVFDHDGCFLVKILGTNELGTNKLLDGVYLGFPEVNKLL